MLLRCLVLKNPLSSQIDIHLDRVLTEIGVPFVERVGGRDPAVDALSVPLAALPEQAGRLQGLVGAHLNGDLK